MDRRSGLASVAVVLVAADLRMHLAALPPLLDRIRVDLGLGAGAAGLITTLPVLCFAAGSFAVAPLARRLGGDRALTAALVAVALAVAARPWGDVALLVAGTLALGLAITVGNVLLPVVVAQRFPLRVPLLMGASAAAFSGGAAVVAAAAVPVAALVGWRGSAAWWAVPALVTAGAWWMVTRLDRPPTAVDGGGRVAPPPPARSPWRSPRAWALVAFFGIQSGAYYAMTTWLPTYLTRSGATEVRAGMALALYQGLGIAGALGVPLAARVLGSARPLAAGAGVLWVLALGGLLAAPGGAGAVVWSSVGGLAQGAGIATALLLITRIGGAAPAATSGFVQGLGYAVGALAPTLVGWASAEAGWGAALVGLMAATAVMAVLGAALGGTPASPKRPDAKEERWTRTA